MAPLAGTALVAVVWVVGGRAGWASGMVVTPAEALRPLVGDDRDLYARATMATLTAAGRGLLIGSTLAVSAAVLAALVPVLSRAIARLAAIANAAPWVAVAPCLLIILGRANGPTAVAAIAVFFYMFTATSIGLASAPRPALEYLRVVGSSRRRELRAVQLPACLPSVADGLKLAAPAALAGTIFGEWYGADRGLGVLLIGGMQAGRPERLWAASLISAVCGLLAFGAFALARRSLVDRFGAEIASAPARRVDRSWARTLLAEVMTILAVGTVLVGAWYAWVELRDISPLVVPRPSRVWADLVASPGVYLSATAATLLTALAAFVVGSGAALGAAGLAARIRLFAGAAVPVIVLMAATPLVALFPLFARVLGYNPSTVRALAAVMVFFPVFVYAHSGLRATRGVRVDVVDALGGSPHDRFTRLSVPGAVPHAVSGMRIAAGSSVIAAVVGESLIGRQGLGVVFTGAYRNLVLPRAFGAAIVIMVVSVAVFSAAGAVERAVHRRWT
jgi:ABC-type nitrate/sulfonate/bicarbonate transport system permease component